MEPVLSRDAKKRAGAMMRVNHVGEVCAQALYLGQALVCREVNVAYSLEKAGRDEAEHLAWTAQRIAELGGRKSYLNPVWYLGAVSIGIIAGTFGDAWSLGFLVETERQVEAHLGRHLRDLPPEDVKSRAIVLQMRSDEVAHAEAALGLGGKALPLQIKVVMGLAAGLMTRTAYYL